MSSLGFDDDDVGSPASLSSEELDNDNDLVMSDTDDDDDSLGSLLGEEEKDDDNDLIMVDVHDEHKAAGYQSCALASAVSISECGATVHNGGRKDPRFQPIARQDLPEA